MSDNNFDKDDEAQHLAQAAEKLDLKENSPVAPADVATPPPKAMESDDQSESTDSLPFHQSDTDDDDDDDNDKEIDSGNSSPALDNDEVLVKAVTEKEQGNLHFKDNQLPEAVKCYRKGVQLLKKINKNNTGDDQTKSLLLALQNNLSMVYYKQEKYRLSKDVAHQAVCLDPCHVKALYRRAVAYKALGHLAEARSDLKQALQGDPTNLACKKELFAVKQALEDYNQNQKLALAKAFGGSTSFLYNDKEIAEERKAQAKERQKLQDQELYKKRKKDWEDDCVKRMAKNEPAISFEDWEKEQKKVEKKRQKAQERQRQDEEERRKEVERRRQAERKAAADHDKDDDDDDDDHGLTEQELAQMRGYKKTKDGRITSYFTRELSEEEKQRLADAKPRRLSESSPASSSGPARISASSASAWNRAGTWEEKNTTEWCTAALREKLLATHVSAGCLARVKSVEELTGEASVALAGGKKSYIFDFHAKLIYELTVSDAETSIASGAVQMPDICSTHHEELEVTFEGWTKKPTKGWDDVALRTRQSLADALRTQVQGWVDEFNAQY